MKHCSRSRLSVTCSPRTSPRAARRPWCSSTRRTSRRVRRRARRPAAAAASRRPRARRRSCASASRPSRTRCSTSSSTRTRRALLAAVAARRPADAPSRRSAVRLSLSWPFGGRLPLSFPSSFLAQHLSSFMHNHESRLDVGRAMLYSSSRSPPVGLHRADCMGHTPRGRTVGASISNDAKNGDQNTRARTTILLVSSSTSACAADRVLGTRR